MRTELGADDGLVVAVGEDLGDGDGGVLQRLLHAVLAVDLVRADQQLADAEQARRGEKLRAGGWGGRRARLGA